MVGVIYSVEVSPHKEIAPSKKIVVFVPKNVKIGRKISKVTLC